MTLFAALFSHYRRHPLQLVALALMILVATTLWSGVRQLTEQARASLSQSEQVIAGRQQVLRVDGAGLTVSDFVTLRRAGLCVMPWLEVPRQGQVGVVIGVDPLAAACFDGGGGAFDNAALRLESEPFVDIGEAVRLARESPAAERRPSLVLIASGNVTAGALPGGYRLETFARGPETGELGESFLLNLDALGVLVLLITALLLRAVYRLGIVQRRESFALLHRFGVPPARIDRWLIMELLTLSALCILPGLWLGRELAGLLGQGFGRSLQGLFDAPLYSISGQWLAPALSMMAVVLVACLADFLVPGGRRVVGSRGHGKLAGILLGLGLLLALLGPSLIWVFAAVAIVFAGAGLLIPILIYRLAERAACARADPLVRWRYRELAVMARQLALPVVALQFTFAMVLAIQALVTTFEDTFDRWLAQRLEAELYVPVPEGRSGEAAARWLAAQPELKTSGAWHRVIRGRAGVSVPGGTQTPVDVFALSPVSSLLTGWDLLASGDDPWASLAGEQAVLVNEQLARRLGLSVGDRLELQLAGQRSNLPVAGIYADYGRPAGEILINGRLLPEQFQPEFESFSISPGALSRARLRSGLESVWQVSDITLRDNEEIRDLATGVFDQTFLLTRSMTVLTLALAGLALLIMGWVFFTGRAWYFRLLATWGLSRREVAAQLTRLSVGLTGRVALLALPLGIWLTWVLVHRINPLAFGWSLPMAVYPGFWVELVGLSLLIGLGIALLMGRQLRAGVAMPASATSMTGGER
ncbi:ABC transporter permease [Marinobacter pelagius]|uniref:FtsX-like permease family protein n=1 Tax=Marinobacter sp. C7 TaxID=2951363 RepID=UPI001EF112F3|nr:FtsX-like permease family protein [Marinobacter sp. C7]MCG7200579.1 ABC transporter permease [Marinobacter sp. C7]